MAKEKLKGNPLARCMQRANGKKKALSFERA